MKTFILGLVLTVCFSSVSVASIFDSSLTHEQEVVQEVKNISQQNARLKEVMKNMHASIFNQIWNNPNATPQEIIDGFGADAIQLFIFSSGIQQMLAGAEADYEPLVPPYEHTISQEGVITVGDKIAVEEHVEEEVVQ